MENQVLINTTFNETRVAVLENESLAELYIEKKSQPLIVGNIYKGKVGKVLPGMQAAFVDIGLNKSGFISAEDVQEESYFEYFLNEDEEEFKSSKIDKNLIQDVLRNGQELLVQVLKEPSGGKGPKLSSYIAIPGKYLVLLGNVDTVGISKRIENEEDRKILSEFIKNIKPKGLGFIVRTAALEVEHNEIAKDLEYLISLWNEIKQRAEVDKSPLLLYEEPKLFIRIIRDMLSKDLKKIIVDSNETKEEMHKYYKSQLPNLIINIESYNDNKPLFSKFRIEEEIKKIFEKKLWLKSGGHLIIEEAEGLTVIDVNTGKYLSETDHEETIYNINKEAAFEIVRQIRLRNLVGIIVIDFIDLKNIEKREEIYNVFTGELKKDKARSVVLEISPFGVVQMTRQRLRESILKTISEPCEYCQGIGYIKSKDTIIYEILRNIQREIIKPFIKEIQIYANEEILDRLRALENTNLEKLVQDKDIDLKYKTNGKRMDQFEIKII